MANEICTLLHQVAGFIELFASSGLGLLLLGSIAFWHSFDRFLGARHSFDAALFNTELVIYILQLFASLYLFCDERGG
jgi:hypothetical protein